MQLAPKHRAYAPKHQSLNLFTSPLTQSAMTTLSGLPAPATRPHRMPIRTPISPIWSLSTCHPLRLKLQAIFLILAGKETSQVLRIFHHAIHTLGIHPESQSRYTPPKQHLEGKTHPEQEGPVRHVQNAERNKEEGEEEQDGSEVRLGGETGDQRLEECLEGAEESER